MCNWLFFKKSITKYITEYFYFTQLHYQLLKTKATKIGKIKISISVYTVSKKKKR